MKHNEKPENVNYNIIIIIILLLHIALLLSSSSYRIVIANLYSTVQQFNIFEATSKRIFVIPYQECPVLF